MYPALRESIEHLRESIENLRRTVGASAPEEAPASGDALRFHIRKSRDLPPCAVDIYLQTANLCDTLAATRLSRESRLSREAQPMRLLPQLLVDGAIVPVGDGDSPVSDTADDVDEAAGVELARWERAERDDIDDAAVGPADSEFFGLAEDAGDIDEPDGIVDGDDAGAARAADATGVGVGEPALVLPQSRDDLKRTARGGVAVEAVGRVRVRIRAFHAAQALHVQLLRHAAMALGGSLAEEAPTTPPRNSRIHIIDMLSQEDRVLSEEHVNELLRTEFGYDGVPVSPDGLAWLRKRMSARLASDARLLAQ